MTCIPSEEDDLHESPCGNAGILTHAVSDGESFAFSMCNPPFFSKWEEAGQNPFTAFQGTATEMVCPGGELAFVQQMVADSLELKVWRNASIA